MATEGLRFKIASLASEFDQIHRLNYRTFVEEIPQHPSNPARALVDRFHTENTYYICLDSGRLVGMLAVRDNRPFSLDDKMPDLDRWLPPGESICEIRLLAVEPEYRRPTLFAGLLHFAASECIRRGYTMGVASGTVRQTHLYQHMGFIPFGEEVGSADARYQPMSLSLQAALSLFSRLKMEVPEVPPSAAANFLPGPVAVSPAVREAFGKPAISHRAEAFLETVEDTRSILRDLTKARHAELFLGSGTLANDVAAAHLRVQEGSGVILSNGEFGERLVDHARRMALSFEVLRVPWGEPFDTALVEANIAATPGIGWLWSTHCETSSGILNDVGALAEICGRRGIKLCLDCTSSLGTVPVDLSEVFLATSVSGKGLASYPGISLVFYNDALEPDERIPRYLDLGYYRSKRGVPFTHSSNLAGALHQALRELDPPVRFETIRRQHTILRDELTRCGIAVMVDERHAAPAVVSVQLPPERPSLELGEALERRGFLLSYRSKYLVERNIIQACLMGSLTDGQCHSLAAQLTRTILAGA
ncbi:aminotransferase class V-fold PLP-dependent enzyme [Geomonas sp. Red32]|uniref:aminotransferase class V-fold PLP-dependent enzyme n=1 Tax=Geomonas sp. Red32 TaxID=2912856 RepID=UPI00202CF34F|nr:GNAT family N-acetyltransferase [Geomonas sp. Red32]MCM0081834.1 aminotransferase class V-fold PLP-dependent enzyme [Geomonas sp. Red32]